MRVLPAAAVCPAAATRLGRSPSPSDGPAAKITARSIAFLSSRRLPGQEYWSTAWRASAENPSISFAELPGEKRQHVFGELEPVGSLRRGGSVSSTTFRRNSRSSRNWPGGHRRFQVAVGCRDQANVGRPGAGFSHSLVAPFLKESQKLGLKQERKVADLVEEETPAFGGLDLALGVGDGPRERAPGVAEELAFKQFGVQARAAHRDKRPRGPPAPGVDRPGQHALARPAFSANQDDGVGGGDLVSLLENQLQLGVMCIRTTPRAPR